MGEDGYYLEDRDYHIFHDASHEVPVMGYLALDLVNTIPFIIKTQKRLFTENDKEAMIRESQILQHINHKNVIRFYGAVEDLQDHTFKIFLEYADETCKKCVYSA